MIGWTLIFLLTHFFSVQTISAADCDLKDFDGQWQNPWGYQIAITTFGCNSAVISLVAKNEWGHRNAISNSTVQLRFNEKAQPIPNEILPKRRVGFGRYLSEWKGQLLHTDSTFSDEDGTHIRVTVSGTVFIQTGMSEKQREAVPATAEAILTVKKVRFYDSTCDQNKEKKWLHLWIGDIKLAPKQPRGLKARLDALVNAIFEDRSQSGKKRNWSRLEQFQYSEIFDPVGQP